MTERGTQNPYRASRVEAVPATTEQPEPAQQWLRCCAIIVVFVLPAAANTFVVCWHWPCGPNSPVLACKISQLNLFFLHFVAYGALLLAAGLLAWRGSDSGKSWRVLTTTMSLGVVYFVCGSVSWLLALANVFFGLIRM